MVDEVDKNKMKSKDSENKGNNKEFEPNIPVLAAGLGFGGLIAGLGIVGIVYTAASIATLGILPLVTAGVVALAGLVIGTAVVVNEFIVKPARQAKEEKYNAGVRERLVDVEFEFEPIQENKKEKKKTIVSKLALMIKNVFSKGNSSSQATDEFEMKNIKENKQDNKKIPNPLFSLVKGLFPKRKKSGPADEPKQITEVKPEVKRRLKGG